MPLPDARVEAPIPLWRRPGVRKAVKAAVVVAALAGGWSYLRSLNGHGGLDSARQYNTGESYHDYVRYGGDPDDVRGDLAKLHDSARAHVHAAGGRPHGLDVLLAPLLARVDNRVRLDVSSSVDEASFDAYAASLPPAELVAPHLPGELDQLTGPPGIAKVADHLGRIDFDCASGMTAAFAAATLKDVIQIHELGDILDGSDAPAATPRLEVRVVARASGNAYLAAMSRQIVPGVRLVGEVVLVGESGELGRVAIDASPPDRVEFTTIGGVPFGANEGDMVVGMVESDCRSAALALVKALDGVAPSLEDVGAGSGGGG